MNRIKILREEFNMTQQELANKLQGAKSTIAMYENETRKPSYEVLIKLSDIFNCSIDYLLGKSDIRNVDLSNIRIAQHNGIDTNGLSEEDIEEIKKQVEYMKWKKGNK